MPQHPPTAQTPRAVISSNPAAATRSYFQWQTILDRPFIACGFIFFVALAIRLIFLFEMRGSALFSVLLGDSAGYDRWAKQITSGQWIGTEVFYQAPFYPYFLAIVYTIFGPSTWAVRIIQALIGALTAALLTHAGRKWFGALPGLLTGLMLAFYPPAIFFDGMVQKSVFDALWISGLLAVAPAFDARKSLVLAALTGGLLGLFALTRENALALVPVFTIWMAIRPNKDRRRRMQHVAALWGGLLLVLLPVGLRNATIGGRFLLTTAQFGPNFYIGNNPQADGFYQPLRKWRAEVKFEQRDAKELAESAAGRTLTPAEVSRYWSRRSWDFIRTQPLAWMKLTWRKWLMTWNASENIDTEAIEAYSDESWLLYLTGPFLHFGLLAPFAAIGVTLTMRRWRTLWLLYAIIAVLAVSVALFFVFARYRFPLVHPLMLFAAVGAYGIAPALRRGAFAAILIPAMVGGGCLLAVNVPNFAQMQPRALTYANVAGALVDAGRHDDAKRYFDRAFAVYPDLPELQYAYGEALGKQGRYVEAAAFLKKVVAVHPDLADVRLLLAQTLVDAGEPQEAVVRCAEALDLAPADLQAREQCARVLVSAGNYYAQRAQFAAAEPCYRQALKLDAHRADTMNNLGLVLAQLGQSEEAQRWFNSAIAAAPHLADAHNNLGQVLQARGDTEMARVAFLRALEIDPAHALARQNLSQLENR